jgi:hypothetical protein
MIPIFKSLPRRKTAAGFALPAILVVVGALLILAVGILLVVGIERKTARSFSDRQRAALAARAGLEDVKGILNLEATNDDFLVIQSTLASPITTGFQSAPNLFLARGKMDPADNTKFSYRYVPLFSTLSYPASNALLKAPVVEPLLTNGSASTPADQYKEFTTLPYNDKVRASWLPVKDEKGRMVARYAYWVEDLQGRLDPMLVGNLAGTSPANTHVREPYPFPAPGLNPKPDSATEPPLNQVALYTIDATATQDQQKTLGKTLIDNRKLLVSPESLLSAAAIQPPITRNATGRHTDANARSVEENLATGIQPYKERPVVPFADGIAPAEAGKLKLNLNALLAKPRDTAITEFSQRVKTALKTFEASRKGGFPDDYAATLAANALDYADADGDASYSAGKYRGLDAYPLVSEFLLKARWENIRTVAGRKIMDLSVSTYVEVWNMTNKTVSGSMEVSYETKYQFQIPPNPNFPNLGDLTKAPGHNLVQKDGNWWYPAIAVQNLRPNEYRVFKCGTVNFSFDAVSSSEFIASPILLGGEVNGASGAGYKMRWNNLLVDQSRGAVDRPDASLHYPNDSKSSPRQKIRCTVPSHSHTRGGFINNMGDPRMSFYNQSPQDSNIFPQNYSPNRRNIRMGTIYSPSTTNSNADTHKVFGRVLPSEWPDGGHDSPFGTDTMFGLVGYTQSAFNDEQRLEPDNPGFLNSLPYNYTTAAGLTLSEREAPHRLSLSNVSRFYSATELGRVYDPIMWQVRSSTLNVPGISWGDVTTTSTSSTDYGGGNTLRIGRPEHLKFDQPGLRATRLLDLFHTGFSRSEDVALRGGDLIDINGQININTASKSAIRSILAGRLVQDPEIRRFDSNLHEQGLKKLPAYTAVSPAPDPIDISNRIADAIIRSRPFASTSDVAVSKELDGTVVFGNPKLFPAYTGGASGTGYPLLQWTDSAAEESFARTYEASTVRSRNFRVWVVAQAVAPSASTTSAPEVLSEVRKCYSIFADPGARNSDGTINPLKYQVKVLNENDF